MAKFNCFCWQAGKKTKNKVEEKSPKKTANYIEGQKTLEVKPEHPAKILGSNELNSTSFSVTVPFGIMGNSKCKVKVMSHESPVGGDASEVAYEGEDEHEENSSIKRDFSDFDLQAHVGNSGGEEFQPSNIKMNISDSFDSEVKNSFEDRANRDAEKGVDSLLTGHLSDPGIGKGNFWASPKLKRTCSNLETSSVLKKIAYQLPPSKSQSFEELQELAAQMREEVFPEISGSPGSQMTRCSADRVMLKKHSSSQVLPSRSRKLWWKLFLWSHRNSHRPSTAELRKPPMAGAFNQQGGYSSDTLEPSRVAQLTKLESPRSFTEESRNESCNINQNDSPIWGNFHGGVSGLWPQNQWVAFSTESSSLTRVEEWVKDLETQFPLPVDESNNSDEGIVVYPPSPARSLTPVARLPNTCISDEVLHACNVVQSLNSSSTVAHISGISLKVVPSISSFSSLRSINLSGNFIVHVTPGSLPKGVHTLNLSRNKINTIEGLRELTRLRVLDLSYNKICRIGHGLSNCTVIKELYLAGNKISDVEGLHRLLKLAVLDLSFNKITTTKALGQLVANYNSLLALNLLGNPIQSNIGDDQLRKTLCSLLPKLAYLNKQAIKPQRVREVATDNVARAALGNGSWGSRRKVAKRVTQVGAFSSSVHRSNTGTGHKSRSKSTNRTHHHHHHSPLKAKSSSALASSSH